MDRIDQLEKRVRNLSIAVRLGVAVVTAAFAIQCWIVLARAPHFGDIFADLLGGAALPALTVFFLSFATPIAIGACVLALLTIVCLFAFPHQSWTIPLGVFVAIIIIAITQLAAFSFQLPMMHIISSLSS